jgi:hypothetical protein
VLDDVASFYPPISTNRSGCEICDAEVGGVVMQRRAVLAEQPPELSERLEVTAVGESRDAEGTPGPDVHQTALGRVDGGESLCSVPGRRAGVGAQRQWSIIATVAAGQLTDGQLPGGTRKLSVKRLG